MPFIIASKGIKYLGINLAKEAKDLYPEKYKTCWKKLKETQIYEKSPLVHGLEDLMLLKGQYYPNKSKDSVQSLSNPNAIFFCRKRKTHPKIKIYMESQGTPKQTKSWKRITKLDASHFLISKLTRKL